MDKLTITEIYTSVQGEAAYAGWPCVFVRLAGCPLRCRWCDTSYAFQGGESQSIEEIVAAVLAEGIPLVELTGGEPMAQAATPSLMEALLAAGLQVMVETGGSESLAAIPVSVHIIMDIKCPGSGMESRNRWENMAFLKPSDEIKFVIADRADFDWAVSKIRAEGLEQRFQLLMSAAFGLLKPADLVSWILAERLKVRLNLQQHKYIWNPRAKGV